LEVILRRLNLEQESVHFGHWDVVLSEVLDQRFVVPCSLQFQVGWVLREPQFLVKVRV
jgi:hypothetical protein